MNFHGVKVFSFLIVVFCSSMVKGVDINGFFPNVGQNLTKITWAHAVNNQTYLNSTLQNASINMIEADILIGKIINGTGLDIPIMGHPPANTSDLSLQSFLDQVNGTVQNGTKKGVKLDFKTIEAFNASITIVTSFDKGLFPIWINADILSGPINANNTPVDATNFLQRASSFPNSTLSIGWTTANGSVSTGAYQSAQITEMIQTIRNHNVSQNITFPVRAVFAANSIELLTNLTSEIKNSTLTVWSSEGDNVNVTNLNKLIKTIGINHTYIDVPNDLLQQLHLQDDTSSSSTIRSFRALFLVVVVFCFRNIFNNLF